MRADRRPLGAARSRAYGVVAAFFGGLAVTIVFGDLFFGAAVALLLLAAGGLMMGRKRARPQTLSVAAGALVGYTTGLVVVVLLALARS